MTKILCLASTDEDFNTLAECTRRDGHDGHHCDTRRRLAWDAEGAISCAADYDHGQPPNRAARRANTTLRPRHLARIRRNDGRNS